MTWLLFAKWSTTVALWALVGGLGAASVRSRSAAYAVLFLGWACLGAWVMWALWEAS